MTTTDKLLPCAECGMPVATGEYHPFAACLMFKACHNSETVRANLAAVRESAAPQPSAGEAVVVPELHPQGLYTMDQMREYADAFYRTRAALAEPQPAASVPDGVIVDCYAIPANSENRFASEIQIQRAKQITGPDLWKVKKDGDCLNRDGEWEYEPLPSSRDDDFIDRCRWGNAEAAIGAALAAAPKLHGEGE